jgi:hypothetical protein
LTEERKLSCLVPKFQQLGFEVGDLTSEPFGLSIRGCVYSAPKLLELGSNLILLSENLTLLVRIFGSDSLTAIEHQVLEQMTQTGLPGPVVD